MVASVTDRCLIMKVSNLVGRVFLLLVIILPCFTARKSNIVFILTDDQDVALGGQVCENFVVYINQMDHGLQIGSV